MSGGLHPGLRRALGLALLLVAATWSGSASACVWVAPIVVTESPPASLTDPEDIEEWKRQKTEAYEAYRMVEIEQAWREYKEQLAREAQQAPSLPAGKLAEDLAADMVPPLLPQFAYSSDCGDLYGPELRDPAGYLQVGRRESAAYLVELGILESADDHDRLPARFVRDLPDSWPSCTQEARGRVEQMLAETFTPAELAHVWSTLHRLGFNYNSVEGAPGFTDYPKRGRVLQFTSGRSGPLEVAAYARPLDQTTEFSWVIADGQRADRAELSRFFAEDPVAIRMVNDIESALAGEGTERCPQTQVEIAAVAAEVRAKIEESRRPRRAQQ